MFLVRYLVSSSYHECARALLGHVRTDREMKWRRLTLTLIGIPVTSQFHKALLWIRRSLVRSSVNDNREIDF